MNGQMVLLRVVQGIREDWKWMDLDDFHRRIDLNALDVERIALVGTGLPRSPDGRLNQL
jgi:hypothetical protein